MRTLIAELHKHVWPGPYAATMPLRWDFQFTEPMRKILDVGPPAQAALVENLKDPAIKDQVIILLGGLGDERVVTPIIDEEEILKPVIALMKGKDAKYFQEAIADGYGYEIWNW